MSDFVYGVALFGFLAWWWKVPSVLDDESLASMTMPILPNYMVGQIITALQYFAVLFGMWLLLKPVPLPANHDARNVEERCKEANFRRVDMKAEMTKIRPVENEEKEHSYLVIGAGFVGKKLIHALLLRGETKIRAFDLDPNACKVFGNRVEFIQGDVTNAEQVAKALQGVDTVFSTFAIIRYMDYLPHEKHLSYKINVIGTKVVVEESQKARVKYFIQTSSSNVSVGYDCTFDMDEKSPYVTPETSPNHYGWTKAESERIVLEANGVNGMRCAVARPCSGVFGAQDNHMLDPLLKTGHQMLPHTRGLSVIDFICAENVVYGHLLVEKQLRDGDKDISGHAFCFSNNDPLTMLDFFKTAANLRPGGISFIPTPYYMLFALSHVVDFVNRFCPQYKRYLHSDLVKMTPATWKFLQLNYTFKSSKAEQLLGYKPLYTVEEGVQKAVQEYVEGKMLPPLPIC